MRFRHWLIEQREPGVVSGLLGFGATMVGGLPSIENFVPVAGPATRAAMAARFGRVGGLAMAEAVENVVTTAAAAPFVYASQAAFGDDVSFADVALDLGVGAALGGVFGAARGAIGRWRARADAHTPEAVAGAQVALDAAAQAVARGEPVRVSPGVLADIARQAERTGEVRAAPVEDMPAGRVAFDPADPDGSMARFVAAVEADPRSNAPHMVLGPVDEATAARVRDQAGVDVAGYAWLVDASAYRHTTRRHGPTSAAANNGDTAILAGDMARFDLAVRGADSTRRTVTAMGMPALEFTARMGGVPMTITAVRTGRKALSLVTMYWQGKSGGPSVPDAGAAAADAPRGLRPRRAEAPPSTRTSGSARRSGRACRCAR